MKEKIGLVEMLFAAEQARNPELTELEFGVQQFRDAYPTIATAFEARGVDLEQLVAHMIAGVKMLAEEGLPDVIFQLQVSVLISAFLEGVIFTHQIPHEELGIEA